jgi:hypothetical protein
MPTNVNPQSVPDPEPHPRWQVDRYFSRSSLEAALDRECSASDVDLNSDRLWLLRLEINRPGGPEGVVVEDFTDQFDILASHRERDLARKRFEPEPSGSERPKRRSSLHVQTEVANEPVEAEFDRPFRPGEVKPGVFTGRAGVEHLRQLDEQRDAKEEQQEARRQRAEGRTERREASRVAAAVEAAQHDRTPSQGSVPEEPPDTPNHVEVKPDQPEERPTPRKKGYAVPKAKFISVDAGLLERPGLTMGAKVLYSHLANWSHVWKGKPPEAAQPALADALATTRQQIGRWTEELEKAGLIKCKRRGARNPSLYTVMPLPRSK